MVVRKVDKVLKPTIETDSYQIPLEVIARYYLDGSLLRRVEKGKIPYQELGFTSKPSRGDKLPEPFLESTTKFEKVDRHLSPSEALEVGGLTKAEYEEIEETVLRIDNMVDTEVESRGLLHVDGKKEFGFAPDRQLMIIDTFGTGDEDRFWLKGDYEDGKLIELSKEYVRQHYKKTGYYDELMDIRDKNKKLKKWKKKMLPESDIPALPEDIIQGASELYAKLHTMLTGEAF
jgi:phosphoribosylaminoimidazole-succinocarboxamide synthase